MKNDVKSHWSDAELIRHCLDNDDETTFEVLDKRYRVPVLNYISKRVKDRSDAEEIAQDTFLQAYNYLKTLRDAEKFLNWMFSIAGQQIIIWSQKNLTRIEFEPISDVSEQTLYAAAVMADLLDQERAIDDALLEYVRGLIDALPERQRDTLLLQLEGFKYEEIADQLGVSAGAVKHLLYRARKSLEKQVVEVGWPDEDLEE
jgi:RNA polymerase sigma-70 factor (ECF subfamily)